MKYHNVTNPEWGNAEKTVINCVVDFEGIGVTPFSASASDAYAHSLDIFARCSSGEFGEVLPYTALPTGVDLQEVQAAEARTYLANTDWYVSRFMETGVAIPEDVTLKRQQARESIQ